MKTKQNLSDNSMVALYKLLRPKHVSFSLFVILDYIEKNRGCTISDIADALDTSRTPIHNHLSALRRLSLIETYTSEDLTDFRRVRVFPTLKGFLLVQNAHKILEKYSTEVGTGQTH